MANNLYNKQVSPKGYKKGGQVSGRINLKKNKKKKTYKRNGMEFNKPLGPKGTFDLGNPPKRYDVAKGGMVPNKKYIKKVSKELRKK